MEVILQYLGPVALVVVSWLFTRILELESRLNNRPTREEVDRMIDIHLKELYSRYENVREDIQELKEDIQLLNSKMDELLKRLAYLPPHQ